MQTLLQESSDEPIGDGAQYRNIRELIQAVSHWKQVMNLFIDYIIFLYYLFSFLIFSAESA
jgi:hypothetical protein